MTKRPALIPLAIVAGIALLALAGLYFIDSADALPSFIPGHQAGSAHHHVKHGIAALLLGIACFVFAWFQTEPSERSRAARAN
jgi:hypothetical protein